VVNRWKSSVLVFLASTNCGECTPPPCSPPPPTSIPDQCAPNPPGSWSSVCQTTQLDEEEVLYSAKLAFSALPTAIQQQYQQQFDSAINVLNQADGIIVAVCKAGTPPTPAQLDAIAQAVQTFLTTIEPILTSTSSGQTQLANVHKQVATMLAHMGK